MRSVFLGFVAATAGACAAPSAKPEPPIQTAAPAEEPSTQPARAKGSPAPELSVVPAPAEAAATVKLQLVTDQTKEATALVAAPEPKGRLFVLEKRGVIRVLKGSKFNPQPFLDLQSVVKLDDRDNGERGLLGLAFHPQFAKNGRFYINYTSRPDGTTRVEERRVGRNKDKADPKAVKLLLEVEQPYSNHNAGDLAFGPDGKLYVGLGDGGAANDPKGHGQNSKTLLGSMLRLDVEAASPQPEVVAIGLRNPWRISFDAKTGDLFIADVGQNLFEYVHLLTAKQLANVAAPYNLGWNVMEGFHCFQDKPCDPSQYQAPMIEYPHKEGCSITGGYVYRGKQLPLLQGQYFYADYCTGLVRSLGLEAGRLKTSWDWKPSLDPESRLARLASFGQDQDGELYLVTHEGPIFKFVPANN